VTYVDIFDSKRYLFSFTGVQQMWSLFEIQSKSKTDICVVGVTIHDSCGAKIIRSNLAKAIPTCESPWSRWISTLELAKARTARPRRPSFAASSSSPLFGGLVSSSSTSRLVLSFRCPRLASSFVSQQFGIEFTHCTRIP
jgi:hypothetical protein